MRKARPTLRGEIESFLHDYETTRLRDAKQVLATLTPLDLCADEIEQTADRIEKVDRKALYWVMRRIVKRESERLEAAREGA
jgi:hypothetical protein